MLYDIDKNADDRSNPTVNKHDQMPLDVVMSRNTITTSYTANSTKQARVQFQNDALTGYNVSNQPTLKLNNNGIATYDSNNNITSYYGYIQAYSSIPVLIIAKVGFDVFNDVLGIPRPTGL